MLVWTIQGTRWLQVKSYVIAQRFTQLSSSSLPQPRMHFFVLCLFVLGMWCFGFWLSGENLESVSASLIGRNQALPETWSIKSLLSVQDFDRSRLNYFSKYLQEQLVRDFLICVKRSSRKCWFFYSRVVETEPRLTPWAWRCPQIFFLLLP